MTTILSELVNRVRFVRSNDDTKRLVKETTLKASVNGFQMLLGRGQAGDRLFQVAEVLRNDQDLLVEWGEGEGPDEKQAYVFVFRRERWDAWEDEHVEAIRTHRRPRSKRGKGK